MTCLAKKPIVRDPHIFDRKEAARGSRAREVTCRIQKWNIKAEGFHPILVANARVDWLAMDDDDITKKFPILLEGILQDVYSQRAASAWQGAQPQKLTVSMLLPGTSSAAEWRDLLQSRRQFWPTLTTRHASLVPVSAEALQRERRQMQAKHLWYNVDIRWSDLKDKLEVLAPTGLTRDDIWRHLFLTKQRKNPYEEGWQIESEYELLQGRAVAVLVRDRTAPFYLISVYLHPNNTQLELSAILRAWKNIDHPTDKVVIAGDFNHADEEVS